MARDTYCDKCGRTMTTAPGQVLFAQRVQTAAERLGRYGRRCRREVVRARVKIGLRTWSDTGREVAR